MPVGGSLNVQVIAGSQGTANASATWTITFDPYMLTATPTSRTILVGESTSYALSSTLLAGAPESATLSVLSGCPSNTTCTIDPPNPISTGGGSTTLSVVTTGSTIVGTYPIVIQAVAPSATVTATATLVVQVSDFSMAATPASLTLVRGANGNNTFTVTTTLVSGVAESATLSAIGCPTGTTCAFAPNPMTTAGGSATLTITTTGLTPTGTVDLTIQAAAPTATHVVVVSLTVLSQLNGGTNTDLVPTTGTTTCYGNPNAVATCSATTTTNTFNGAGGLTVSALTPTIAVTTTTTTTVQFQIRTFTGPNGTGTGTTTSTGCTIPAGATTCVSANAAVVPVGGSLNIQVIGGAQSGNTVTATWVVSFTPFAITASPTADTIAQGSATGYSIYTALLSGIAETATLSVSGCPALATCLLNNTSVSTNGGVSPVATLTVTTDPSTPVFTYQITVQAVAPSATNSVSVSLTVNPPAALTLIGFAVDSLGGLANGSTNFGYVDSATAGCGLACTLSTTESARQITAPFNLTIQDLTVTFDPTGTVSADYTFTLRVNGVSTALSCTAGDFTAPANNGCTLATPVSLSTGDVFAIMVFKEAPAAASITANWTLTYTVP